MKAIRMSLNGPSDCILICVVYCSFRTFYSAERLTETLRGYSRNIMKTDRLIYVSYVYASVPTEDLYDHVSRRLFNALSTAMLFMAE